MIRICVICGKEFETKSSRQMACSKSCMYKHHYLKGVERKQIANPYRACKICGKQFAPLSKEQFCSDDCKRKSRLLSKAKVKNKKYESGEIKKRLTLEEKAIKNQKQNKFYTCPACGKIFERHYNEKYCCDECRNNATIKRQAGYQRGYQKGYHRKTNYIRKPIVKPIALCKSCGKEFTIDKHHQVYCSHECYIKSAQEYRANFYQAVRDKRYAICPTCDKEFLIDKHHVKYCSNECRELAIQK